MNAVSHVSRPRPFRLRPRWAAGEGFRRSGRRVAVLVGAAIFGLLSTRAALAVDTGIGRAAAAVANIDPASVVVGSTEVRSFPGQQADTGMVQLFRLENTQAPSGEPPVATVNGTYSISLSTPLALGESVFVRHTTTNAVSATATVQMAAAPSISGPLNPGDLLVTGHATPGRAVSVVDAISGATLGTSGAVPGSGAFSVAVPALRLFQAIRAEDNDELVSPIVSVLGFAAVTNAGLPPASCPATVVQPSGPAIIRFACDLLHPRGVAVLPDGSLRILAGVPPSNLLNVPPPATVRFDPVTQVAELAAPVTGVGAAYEPLTGDLFIARPHLFRLRDEHMVERQDGEILQMDPNADTTTVATRLLDIAPTGITVDSSLLGTFGGGLIVSSLFYAPATTQFLYPLSPSEPAASAIWSASLSGVVPLSIAASLPLARIHGLAVGEDWDTAPALFATQPGSGTIFRILGSSGNYTAAPLVTGLGSPVEVAFAPTGSPFGSDLYATDAEGGRIVKITIGAGSSSTVQNYVTGLGRPFGLTFSSTGLFVTEYSGSIVAIYP